MPRHNPQLEELGRRLLIGVGRIGGRAVASGVKSVMDDGRRLARQAEERFGDAIKGLDEMLHGDNSNRDESCRDDERNRR